MFYCSRILRGAAGLALALTCMAATSCTTNELPKTPPVATGAVGDPAVQIRSCGLNLKQMATALEMYAGDQKGRYPTALDKITPNYLKSLPVCPAASTQTYSHAYAASSTPDAFTVICEGAFHTRAGQPANFPQYSSGKGLTPPLPSDGASPAPATH